MTDDRTKKAVQDRTRINTSEDYELRYWSEEVRSYAGSVEGRSQKGRQFSFGS